jgi:hypothetical protein
VLNEILGNETELAIVEHVTDTAGFTDIIFALFDLLGLQFSPRLRDLANQRLCKIKGRDLAYPSLKFTSSFDPEPVRRHWDDLLRVTGSLKTGKVTASLLVMVWRGWGYSQKTGTGSTGNGSVPEHCRECNSGLGYRIYSSGNRATPRGKYALKEEDLAFLSPVKYAHINRLVRYSFLNEVSVLSEEVLLWSECCLGCT